MGIIYDEEQRVFKLDTPHTSYLIPRRGTPGTN